MGYVALSRVKSLLGLTLIGLNDMALHVHPEAFEFDRYFRGLSRKAESGLMALSADELEERQMRFLGPEPSASASNVSKHIKAQKQKIPTTEITRSMVDAGRSVRQVAKERGLSFNTILNHIEQIKKEDPHWDISHLKEALPVTRFQKIATAFHNVGMQEGGGRLLTPVKKLLGDSYTFEELRLVRLFL
jgi:hypothetical protein